MDILEAFIGGPVGRYIGNAEHVEGLQVFTQWEINSRRLDERKGSDWWKSVNGLMMLDIKEATALIEASGRSASSDDESIQAWIDYRHGGAKKQHTLWRAHQISLHEGIDSSRDLLLLETFDEQKFARTVVENVDLSALSTFPSDNFGAAGMNHFISGMLNLYPDYGEVTSSNSSPSFAPLIIDRDEYYALIGGNIIGLNSGQLWAEWK